jgi:2Fe-2S ferredoxin
MPTICNTLEKIRVRYIDSAGKSYDIDAIEGDSLMTVATGHSVRGIDGDCGGNCACGTCLIRLDPATRDRLTPPSAAERELLDHLAVSHHDHRLGCQINVDKNLEGLTFVVPDVT